MEGIPAGELCSARLSPSMCFRCKSRDIRDTVAQAVALQPLDPQRAAVLKLSHLPNQADDYQAYCEHHLAQVRKNTV